MFTLFGTFSLPQLVDPIRYSVHLDGHCYYGNQEEQDH